jgi:hypothetical protein
MSKPANGAARNTMTPMERQCYDWGWEDAEMRLLEIVETKYKNLKAFPFKEYEPKTVIASMRLFEELIEEIKNGD